MKDFIINLYANKYFPIYLGVVIVVLLIAFFVVFFLGKKDQKKIKETQRLNAEAIKKASENGSATVNSAPVKETILVAEKPITPAPQVKPAALPNAPVQPSPVTKVVQNAPVTPMAMPKAEQAPKVTVTPTMPTVNSVKINEVKPAPVVNETINNIQKSAPIVEPTKVEPIKPAPVQKEIKPIISEPIKINEIPKTLNKVSNEETYHANEVEKFKSLASSIDKDLTELENMKQNTNNIPNNEVANNITNTKVVNNIYSSVYVPKKEEPIKEEKTMEDDDFDFEETMNIELPKLKDDK